MDAIIRNEESGERILVCVSPSPSNRKVIAAAARMAEAFRASLTAIYVKPTGFESLSEEDRLRLESNLRFAEQNGASVATVIGDDIPVQVAEYAHVSDTTKIVVGQRLDLGLESHDLVGYLLYLLYFPGIKIAKDFFH